MSNVHLQGAGRRYRGWMLVYLDAGLGAGAKEETVERALRVVERQSEVDYFIFKNAISL